ncbi:hypothetical protein GDO86_014449 [Hymenochirus boettgeri]|uniref:Uncharacterized protein n=1 Tax=Hymenochirus boettgeri TaxID=247094 RepID=A0A8T2JXC0_9PIPI|nr:hypothetical protein GDO86_014449 [Hymenochirus boettgeri]
MRTTVFAVCTTLSSGQRPITMFRSRGQDATGPVQVINWQRR